MTCGLVGPKARRVPEIEAGGGSVRPLGQLGRKGATFVIVVGSTVDHSTELPCLLPADDALDFSLDMDY